MGVRTQGISGARQTKIDHHGAPLRIHQNIGGLQVAVDNPVLMGILDRTTDTEQQGEALRPGQGVVLRVGGQWQAPPHQFHGQIRALFVRTGVCVQPTVVNSGNAFVLQSHQRANLGQKSGEGLPPSRLQQGGMDELHRHLTPVGANVLLRPVDDTTPARGNGLT